MSKLRKFNRSHLQRHVSSETANALVAMLIRYCSNIVSKNTVIRRSSPHGKGYFYATFTVKFFDIKEALERVENVDKTYKKQEFWDNFKSVLGNVKEDMLTYEVIPDTTEAWEFEEVNVFDWSKLYSTDMSHKMHENKRNERKLRQREFVKKFNANKDRIFV